MRAHEIAAQLESFTGRGPGTDAERRAANWLAHELEGTGREVQIESFWCRPNWALAHAWHVALAITGSLVAVGAPRVGLALLIVALISIVIDALFGISPGRRLTFERASQNVVAQPRRGHDPPIRLVLTASYDAGRTGMVYRGPLRRLTSPLRRSTNGRAPGWLAWLCLAIAWLAVTALLRDEGHRSTAVSVAQFVPTALLVLTLAALIEAGTAGYGPAANDNGSGVGVALALLRALDAAPPRHMAVELVLQGAGDGGAIGMRRHLRRRAQRAAPRRRRLRRRKPDIGPHNAAVLAFSACGEGTPRWWTSDGPLLPLRFSRRLRELCADLGPRSHLLPHRGRGTTPAYTARTAGIPAMTIGCLSANELAPRSHQPSDTATALDPAALDATVEFALILIDALDASLAQSSATATATATAATAPAR